MSKYRRVGKILAAIWGRIGFFVPDATYLKVRFRLLMGARLDLENPQTFNEKLNWLKLYDRKPEYHQLVDKYEVKKYVADKIGAEHIIETYGVWERFDDIDFDTLPDQFVIKSTNGGGNNGVVICRNKRDFNVAEAKKRIESSLHTNWKLQREWVYYGVRPRIIAERLLEPTEKSLDDYKIFCFNGIPKAVLLCKDRMSETGLTEDFFTPQWEHISVKRPDTPNAQLPPNAPKHLKDMLDLASKLSADVPFVRVDFYTKGENIFFGEMTFYPAGGLTPFDPNEIDKVFGNWLSLPENGGGKFYIKGLDVFYIHPESNADLTDYKFFCFNGNVDCVMACYERSSHDTKFFFFDRDWNLLRYNKRGLAMPDNFSLPKPKNIEKMFEIAGRLSQGFPFLRVDLYNVDGQIYFGETTFYPDSGFDPNLIETTDNHFGKLIKLPSKKEL